MNQASVKKPLSAQAFLEWEATQAERQIFFHGEVFAMAGGTIAHNSVALGLASELRSKLKQSLCRVFMADVRLEAAKEKHYTYPDVFVTCDPRDRTSDSNTTMRFPCFVAEVLSPSTAEYDRGLKFAGYRSIETVEEVQFIDPERRSLELFTRSANAPDWILHPVANDADLVIPSLGVTLQISELFAGLEAAPS